MVYHRRVGMRTRLISVAVLVLLAGAVAYMSNVWNIRGIDNDGGVACTTEAKLCPDGSAVGRTVTSMRARGGARPATRVLGVFFFF